MLFKANFIRHCAKAMGCRALYNAFQQGKPPENLSELPHAQPNPFRKRPVNIEYTEREYASFYMPSEKAYFFSGICAAQPE